MSYRFEHEEPVVAGLRRIAAREARRALRALRDPDLTRSESIHVCRRRSRRIRAALRLGRAAFGPSFGAIDAELRDAARTLGPLRDARAQAIALERFIARDPERAAGLQLAPLQARLEATAQTAESSAAADARLQSFRAAIERLPRSARRWKCRTRGFDALRGGLRRTYREARIAMTGSTEEVGGRCMHLWRKRVKEHACHLDLLSPSWPKVLEAEGAAAEELAELLGDARDSWLLAAHLAADPRDSSEASALIAAMRSDHVALTSRAEGLGARVFAARPRAFSRRIEACWRAWRSEPSDG